MVTPATARAASSHSSAAARSKATLEVAAKDKIGAETASYDEVVNANLQLGSDTLNYSTTAAAVAVAVNLTTGVASGFTSIVNIENVTGGLGGDNIVGSNGANVLAGFNGSDIVNGAGGDDIIAATTGDGNDTYIGGAGIDFYNLANTTAGATVNLATGVSSSAQTGTDSLSGIEGVELAPCSA